MYGTSALLSFIVVRQKLNFRYYSKDTSKRLLDLLAKMPKSNSARISEAQKQRQNIAKKGKKYTTPSTVYLQVLGSGARGAPSTLYLFSDQKRYLFNCGECTQRLAHEHKVRLTRLDHIFITNKSWQNIGGLPGLSLTLQDVGVPNITLHGPEGLDELYLATKRFVIMKDMNVTMANCTPEQDFEDDVMTVKYVLLPKYDFLENLKQPQKRQKVKHTVDKEFEEFVHDNTDYYGGKGNKGSSKPPVTLHNKPGNRSPTKDTLLSKTGKTLMDIPKPSEYTVAYICTLKKRLGTLDLEKCVKLGVPPGPLLGQLKNGHDVILKGGNIVHASDVKTPDDPGPVFIVLEVPDISYLKEEEFAAHYPNPMNQPENIPVLVVHFTPPHVMNLERYQNFMKSFGPTTRHLVLNSQNSCLGSEAVHRTQHRLHLLDPDIFPLLKDISIQAVWDTPGASVKHDSPEKSRCLEELKNKIAIAQFQNIISMESRRGGGAGGGGGVSDLDVCRAKTLMVHHLRPRKEVDCSAVPKLHIQDYIKDTMDIDGFGVSLSKFKKIADELRDAKTTSNDEYPRVIFLGTGSCIPSKTRNTSGIALQIDENKSMLMDCGEGTFGQLVRFFGSKRVNTFLRSLKAVYISHLHADHHIGLLGVIQARRKAFEEINASEVEFEPLYLLAPGQIYTWLNTYDQQFEKIKSDFTLIPNQSLLEESTKKSDMTAAILSCIGVEKIVTCLVSHCPNAFGVAVHLAQEKKITYSGDTLPCDDLARIGENSTLLIHEATMEDELEDEARIKMHSTTSQAIEMGRAMNASFTVLTHFSQRYARLPRLSARILHHDARAGIAFDNMQISLSDLPLLPYMYAPLQMMFAEHCVEMELRAAQRSMKKEKQAAMAKKRIRKTPSPSPTRSAKFTPIRCKSKETVSGLNGRYQKVIVVAQNEVIRQASKKSIDVRSEKTNSKHSIPQLDDTFNETKTAIRKRCSSQEGKAYPKPAYYKETISSRLRQEMKGMQIFGALRSSSVSPIRKLPNNKCDASADKKVINRAPSTQDRKKYVVQASTTLYNREQNRNTSITNVKNQPHAKATEKTSPSSKKETNKSVNQSILIPEKKSIYDSQHTEQQLEQLNDLRENLLINGDNAENFDRKMKEMQEKLQENLNMKKDLQPKNAVGNLLFSKPRGIKADMNKMANNLICQVQNYQPTNDFSTASDISNGSDQAKGRSHAEHAARKLRSDPYKALVQSRKDTVNNQRKGDPEIPLKRKDSPVDPHYCSSAATVTLTKSKTSNLAPSRRRGNLPIGGGSKKDTSWPKHTRPEVNNISKFEPSLQNIQSTESVSNATSKCTVRLNASCNDVAKPVPFREEDRIKLLSDVKRKFQSKSFKEDFRFERIEGLNWISWN